METLTQDKLAEKFSEDLQEIKQKISLQLQNGCAMILMEYYREL